MVALSQRLEHENIILHRIQELVCGKVDALVQQLEDKEVAELQTSLVTEANCILNVKLPTVDPTPSIESK